MAASREPRKSKDTETNSDSWFDLAERIFIQLVELRLKSVFLAAFLVAVCGFAFQNIDARNDWLTIVVRTASALGLILGILLIAILAVRAFVRDFQKQK